MRRPARVLTAALAAVWRAATYRDTATSHPRADAGLDILRRRRPQDYDAFPGRPS